jgi:hypothetical protein
MNQLLRIKFLFLLSIFFLSCENPLEDRVNKLEDELENQKIEQGNQNKLIETLILQLTKQQTVIDSLNKKNKEYSDSLFEKLHNYTDSVNINYIKKLDSINTNLANYINSLINEQNNIIQAIIDSQPETDNDYLRIDSLQLCWGVGRTNSKGVTLQFPVSFIEPPKIFMDLIVGQNALGVNELTTTSARFYINWDNYWDFNYFALGRWK